MCANSEGSDDKYHYLMSWLIYLSAGLLSISLLYTVIILLGTLQVIDWLQIVEGVYSMPRKNKTFASKACFN